MPHVSCSRCHGTGKVILRRALADTFTCLLDVPMSTVAIRGALQGRVSLSALNMRLYKLAALGLAIRVETEGGYAWRRA